ncbi:protein-cysteine N-palmitoyltransferase Rasp [Aricia agestis]|uniref:protein-cysteine N-palmitoyltransferase Rasp n=1 Tax=Aricia agestis TaxID=91739 RepID=UPI001C203CE1|nr:protein-cysteine N-palmitoyltransferase Rasp [Aricia agestis]
MKSPVKSLELYSYFLIWTCSTIYSLFRLFEAQEDILQRNKESLPQLNDLKPGWGFTSRLKDVSDIEWSSWKYFIQTFWYHLIIQFTISEIIRILYCKLLKYWYIASTVIFIFLNMGVKQMLVIVVQPVFFLIVIYYGGKKLSIWIVSMILLLTYNSLKDVSFFWDFLDPNNANNEEVYLTLFSIAWIQLRCISYSLDYIENRENEQITRNSILNMFTYILYLPLLYTGPIVLYEEFEKSFTAKPEYLLTRLKRFIGDMILYLFYTFILDLLFHYIYFFAMQSDIEMVRQFPTFALCGGGLWMGLEFHLKYVISYGTTTAFARLDNIEPPPTPRCIARIHVYSHMWRYFDVGLYRFLVKYIYRPSYSAICENFRLPRVVYKLMASLLTFIFIFMWHGTVWHIFLWSLFNYCGITLEQFGKVVAKQKLYKSFKEKLLKTDAMEARFIAFLCSPLLALSAISNFYLFAGNDVGNLFFECFSDPASFNVIILITSLYCCCHVSMALEDVPSRTAKKIEKVL